MEKARVSSHTSASQLQCLPVASNTALGLAAKPLSPVWVRTGGAVSCTAVAAAVFQGAPEWCSSVRTLHFIALLSVLISAMWQQNHPAYNGTCWASFLFCTRIFPGCYLQNLFFKSSQHFCCWSSSNRNSFINQTDHQPDRLTVLDTENPPKA